MGQAFSLLGAHDPRLTRLGKMDFRLTRIVSGWKRKDPSPKRKRPIPKSVLLEATRLARKYGQPRDLAIMDLAWIGFFFLLRPSEYLYTQKGSCPFRLQDIIVRVGELEFRGNTIPLFLLDRATFVGLEFTMQKNGIAGELIGLANTTDPYVCPVKAISRRIAHLRKHGATADTPLYVYYDTSGTPRRIADRYLTQQLRIAASLLGLTVATTAGALRCTGATALLQGKVPIELIKLVGRWRSDEVFRYLHTQSEPLMSPLANTMFSAAT